MYLIEDEDGELCLSTTPAPKSSPGFAAGRPTAVKPKKPKGTSLPVAWKLDPGPPPVLVSSRGDVLDLRKLRDPGDVVLALTDVAHVGSDLELAQLFRAVLLLLDLPSMIGRPNPLSEAEVLSRIATAPTRRARRQRREGSFPKPMVLQLGADRVEAIAAARSPRRGR